MVVKHGYIKRAQTRTSSELAVLHRPTLHPTPPDTLTLLQSLVRAENHKECIIEGKYNEPRISPLFGICKRCILHPQALLARGLIAGTADVEITMEGNPTSVEASRLAEFKDAGINRLSLGRLFSGMLVCQPLVFV